MHVTEFPLIVDQQTFTDIVKDSTNIPAKVKVAIVALAAGTIDSSTVEQLVNDHVAGITSTALQQASANAINALVERAKAVSMQ